MSVQKIKAGRVPGTDADNFVGDIGTLFYNEGVGDLRIGDGITVGGIPLSFGSGDGGSYVLPTASATVKGGVKIDNATITIANQVISVGTVPYSSLSDAPSIPTNTNQLTNGAGYITASSLTGLATEAYVTGRGYITSSALTGYATESYVTGRGYITSSALSGLATETYVNNKFGNLTITGNVIDSTDSSAISFTPSVIFDSNITVGGDIIPNSDLGGSLGSLSQQWKSLYVSSSTIYIGGVPLTITNNTLTVNGDPISATVNYSDVQGAPTDISQFTDATGLLNAASGTGKSAYQVAVENGFVGTEAAWLASLVGAQGPAGTNGTDGTNGTNGTNGIDGAPGADGASAYEVAGANGFVGTEAQWLTSLVGATGAAGADGTNGTNGADGTNGTNGADGAQGPQGDPGPAGADGTNGADGADGASAYEVAVANGFSGTEVQWLASLVGATGAAGADGTNGTNGADGAPGADGASAYEVAVSNGFIGTEAAWLATLIGEQGPQGDVGPTGPQGATGEIDLTNISVTTATAYNGSSLSYDNTTGVFTFTPPDLTVYALTTSIPTDISDLTDNNGLLTQGGGASVTVSTTAPSTPESGDLWWNSATGNLYVSYDDTWVISNNQSSGPTALSQLTNDTGYIALNSNGTFSIPSLSVQPTALQVGQVALANGTSWDPLSRTTGTPYFALWIGTGWVDVTGFITPTNDTVYNQILEIG
jgi:hypothetical protein